MTTDNPVVGLINPGAMGTPIGCAALASGARVCWVSMDRSPESTTRAQSSGFEGVATEDELVARCELIISVCPPHAAVEVARRIAALEFKGLYVDANAISPETSRDIGALVESGGARFVDGSIIGGPPVERGTTRLYLSGPAAAKAQQYFAKGLFNVVVVDDIIGSASALKMAYAAWTKGSDALLLNIRALAVARGVEAALLAEWRQSMPGLAERSQAAVEGSVPKAWRFIGEMQQIADTLAATNLPDGFHRGAEAVYDRLSGYKNQTDLDMTEVLTALARPSTGQTGH